ncbi:MAG: RibD family protein [Defluviicoccus sp.]|nr:RibD family protein [Defluviicoccus sp.]
MSSAADRTWVLDACEEPLRSALYQPLVAAMARDGFVIAQLGQSLDGRIATEDGHSHYINGPESLDHLHRLRALVDAVIVGAGTVAHDDPQLTTRRVPGPNPVRVVIDPSLRLDRHARIFDQAAPTLTVIAERTVPDPTIAPEQLVGVAAAKGGLPPPLILAALQRRGLRSFLVEGGAATVSAFIAAGVVDRLQLMVAPLILGSGRPGLQLPRIARVDEGLRPRLSVHRLGDDVLFDCCLR